MSDQQYAMPRRRKTTRNLDCMRVEKKVGFGMYGDVFRAVDITDGMAVPVALKKIKMERETQGFPVTALREIKILNSLNHENVVRMREIVTCSGDERDPTLPRHGFTAGDVFMVFEFVDYDLSAILKARFFDISVDLIKSFIYQLIVGVNYLHERNILHRDIKGANLLITRGNVLKIADLGLARNIPPNGHKLTNPVVTLWYRSPEVILGSKFYGPEVDMWSVGCIFGELWTRTAMFNANVEGQQLDMIFHVLGSPQGPLLNKFRELPDWEKCDFKNFHYNSRLRQSATVSRMDPAALNILEGLLELDPEKRMKANAALNHEYFQSGVRDSSEYPPIDLVAAEAEFEQRKAREAALAQQQAEAKRLAEQQRAATGPALIVPGKDRREKDRMQNAKVSRFKQKPAAGPPAGAPTVPSAVATSSAPAASGHLHHHTTTSGGGYPNQQQHQYQSQPQQYLHHPQQHQHQQQQHNPIAHPLSMESSDYQPQLFAMGRGRSDPHHTNALPPNKRPKHEGGP